MPAIDTQGTSQPSAEAHLILWRHAEAEDLPEALRHDPQRDLRRELTKRGEKQAERVAAWLRRNAPRDLRVLSSPALRTRQTAAALTSGAAVLPELAPDADGRSVLAAIDWPRGGDVLIVGHQPWLGRLASLLLAGCEIDWSVRKAGIWWLSQRIRDNQPQCVLRAVVNPDHLP